MTSHAEPQPTSQVHRGSLHKQMCSHEVMTWYLDQDSPLVQKKPSANENTSQLNKELKQQVKSLLIQAIAGGSPGWVPSTLYGTSHQPRQEWFLSAESLKNELNI